MFKHELGGIDNERQHGRVYTINNNNNKIKSISQKKIIIK